MKSLISGKNDLRKFKIKEVAYMTNFYKVKFYLNSDELATVQTVTTTEDGLQGLLNNEGFEVLEWEETELEGTE